MTVYGSAFGSGPYGSGAWGSGGSVQPQNIELGDIASEEAFDDHIFAGPIILPGIPSEEAFDLHSFSYPQDVTFPGIPSTEAFGGHVFSLIAGRFLGAGIGPTTGGQEIVILAPGLLMEAAEDTFSDGVISPTWTISTTNSGLIREFAGTPRGVLQLSTGRSADSTALLRSASPYGRFDAEATARVSGDFRSGVAEAAFSVGAYVSDDTFFRVSAVVEKGKHAIRLDAQENGSTSRNLTFPVRPFTPVSLRLLRCLEKVLVFVNGGLLHEASWTNADAQIEMRVANDSSGRSSLTAHVARYVQNPVIVFGGEPMREVLNKYQGRLLGLTPPNSVPGLVDILIETDTTEFLLDGQYEYVWPVDFRDIREDGTSRLTTVSDRIVRAS